MNHLAAPTMDSVAGDTPRAGTAMTWMLVAALTAAFFVIEHRNSQVSLLDSFTRSPEEMAAGAAEGDPGRQLGVIAIGLLGVFLLSRREGRRWDLRGPLGWLMLGYLAWCIISIGWSIDPRLTSRHLCVLLLCSIGALGVARQVTVRETCMIALGVTTILVFNSVRVELALGTFQPFSPEYRFAGTLHPNTQSFYCATMALSAACLAHAARRGRMLLWSLCLLGVVLLALTKSRTACASCLVGMLALISLSLPWRKRVLAGAAAIWAAAAVALAGSWLGWEINSRAIDMGLAGRQEETGSLSGRTLLWAALAPYTEEHLLIGHGYDSFWGPRRIEDFSQAFEWTIPDGHCGYLDTVLDLGLIGVSLFVGIILAGIVIAAGCYRASGDAGCGFLFAVLIYWALNTMLESPLASPTSFASFIMMCCLLRLAVYREPNEYARATPLPQEATC
jgi:O-antigen ligase